MELHHANGGFPEPPSGDPVRVVRAAHSACGGETRIRLPAYLPPRAVRRAVCERCAESFACEEVVELERPREFPRLPPPDSSVWRWLGMPLAAAAVVGALLFAQGDKRAPAPVTVGAPGTESSGAASGAAQFVSEPGFSLALPPGWEQTDPEGGATFTAAATEGTADATLWIERAPDLSFAEFEARSLEQLRSLTGNARVVERVAAPSAAGTVVRLRAEAPEGSGASAPYDVTLRAAGAYRYYLATTIQPGASPATRRGAELVHGSFVPERDGDGRARTGAAPGSRRSAAGGAASPAAGEAGTP
jgi:hypothetical protein